MQTFKKMHGAQRYLMSSELIIIYGILVLVASGLYKFWSSKNSKDIGKEYSNEVKKIHKKYDDLGF